MRSFTPSSLVTLPVVDAHEAIALAVAIEAAASPPTTKGKKKGAEESHALPKPVSSAVALIAAKRMSLQQSIGTSPPPKVDVRAADRAEDAAIGAVYDLLSAWERLPDSVAEAKTARALKPKLFSDEAGIGIVHFRYKAEWAAVQAVLDKIDEAVEKQLAALGAAPMIAHLRKVHAEYGKAIQVTEAAPVAEAPKIRTEREALLEAVRSWVLRVVGSVDDEDPATQARADAWLAPLTGWEARAAKSGGGGGASTGGSDGSTSAPAAGGDAQKK